MRKLVWVHDGNYSFRTVVIPMYELIITLIYLSCTFNRLPFL